MKKTDRQLSLLSGTAVKTEKGYFYIKNNVRRPFPTRRVFKSWGFYKAVKAKEDQLKNYPIVGPLGFRDGTLIYCIADATYYIISNNKRVKIDSPDTIREHGLSMLDALWVSKAERDLHGVVA